MTLNLAGQLDESHLKDLDIPLQQQYFLLAIPDPAFPAPDSFFTTPLRLRFHSPKHPIIVLTPGAPKLIRFHTHQASDASRCHAIIATSWKPEHAGRWWGWVIHSSAKDTSAENRNENLHHAGCRAVHMLEKKAESGFQWLPIANDEQGREHLIWATTQRNQDGSLEAVQDDSPWKGWMIGEGEGDLKQLFWITGEACDNLPPGCEKILITREKAWGQPDTVDQP